MSSKEFFPLIILSLIYPKMLSVCDECTVKMVKNISDSFYTFSTNIERPRDNSPRLFDIKFLFLFRGLWFSYLIIYLFILKKENKQTNKKTKCNSFKERNRFCKQPR